MNDFEQHLAASDLLQRSAPARVRPAWPLLLGFGTLLMLGVQGLSLSRLGEPPAPDTLAARTATPTPLAATAAMTSAPTARPTAPTSTSALTATADDLAYAQAVNASLPDAAPHAMAALIDVSRLDLSGRFQPEPARGDTTMHRLERPGMTAAAEVLNARRPLVLAQAATPRDAAHVADRGKASVTSGSVEKSDTPEAVGNHDTLAQEWLMSANPRHYTLQLVSARNAESVSDYFHARHDDQPIALLRLRIKDAAWYSVITGVHDDVDAALAAAAALKQADGTEAWVRRVSAVRAERVETLVSTVPAANVARDTSTAPHDAASGTGQEGA